MATSNVFACPFAASPTALCAQQRATDMGSCLKWVERDFEGNGEVQMVLRTTLNQHPAVGVVTGFDQECVHVGDPHVPLSSKFDHTVFLQR